jgi:Fic family protein
LTEEQITAILENKKVIGPEKDIIEVLNALEVYKNINKLTPYNEKDFLKAHKLLLQKLIEKPGKYRTQSVGIVKGSKVEHVAPPFQNVPFLMKDLFEYLKDKSELTLLKSCVFHYEMEFIHPFVDGNGRMGRLWQTLILIQDYPIFEFLPFETLISQNQEEYYKTLSNSDKEGKSTKFIEYMLKIIDKSLSELLDNSVKKLSDENRIQIFLEHKENEFTRKDYMNYFKDISSATASRDLRNAVEMNLIVKNGDKKTTTYCKK